MIGTIVCEAGIQYERVSLSVAKRKFVQGSDVYLIASKVRIDNPGMRLHKVECDGKIDSLLTAINSYKYYNCNSETGIYVHC